MKNEIRLALLCMAATAAPAFAQIDSPRCGSTNFDQSLNAFTIVNPAAGAVNQQCFITVYPAGPEPLEARRYPGSYFPEGRYSIELVGGGGGGGGGGFGEKGGGGGGAGAAPSRTTQNLTPGVYRLTIGTGGFGGGAYGGSTGDGNPTNMTNAHTGQLIAGYSGAEAWSQRARGAASGGQGGAASPGGSSGGSGGDSGPRSEEPAQAGGMLQTGGYSGRPGQAGSETGRTGQTEETRGIVQANAGGGGGASIGSGASGQSAGKSASAGDGTRGGHGLIKMALLSATPAAQAPTGAVSQAVEAAPETKPARKYRN